MEHTGSGRIPIATLAPSNYRAIHILGQRLERLRQAGVSYPVGGINRFG